MRCVVGLLMLIPVVGCGEPSEIRRGSLGSTPHLLAGVVTGLVGTGLTLASPGEPNVVVPARSTKFEFPKELIPGTEYSVSVVQQPGNPTQTCLVTSGTGFITFDIRNVLVSCAAPGAPTLEGLATGVATSDR